MSINWDFSDNVSVKLTMLSHFARREFENMLKEVIMAIGTVKWFNPAKGYGFIEPEEGGADAFVHISAVEAAGLSSLSDGQKVSYELKPGQNGKSSAEELSIVE